MKTADDTKVEYLTLNLSSQEYKENIYISTTD